MYTLVRSSVCDANYCETVNIRYMHDMVDLAKFAQIFRNKSYIKCFSMVKLYLVLRLPNMFIAVEILPDLLFFLFNDFFKIWLIR